MHGPGTIVLKQDQPKAPTVLLTGVWYAPDTAHRLLSVITLISKTGFPPTTTQPNVGMGRKYLMGEKRENKRRGCQLLELQERGFVTAGLRLQLVCCTRVLSLVAPNLHSRSEPIRGE